MSDSWESKKDLDHICSIDEMVLLAIRASSFGACKVIFDRRPGSSMLYWAVYPNLSDTETGKLWYAVITLSKREHSQGPTDEALEALIAQKVKAAEVATNNAKLKMLERQEKPAVA